jgi:hypothetical protein
MYFQRKPARLTWHRQKRTYFTPKRPVLDPGRFIFDELVNNPYPAMEKRATHANHDFT